jgi:hypothetical protein
VNAFPVSRACELAEETDPPQWLIEGLWAKEAVGVLGAQPKSCKSWLALDMAVSVASGSPCLRRFPVPTTGPVLLFPAEDALGVVHRRLESICAAAAIDIDRLPLYVITAPRLLLDCPDDRRKLRETIRRIAPILLVLDPFIRLHRIDENASNQVAPLLGYLRELQREFHLAVLLVHHTRKGVESYRPGQALRGSSDLHGWGDCNLYLRAHRQHLILTVEHRAAPAPEDILLELNQNASALALGVLSTPPAPEPETPSASRRVLDALATLDAPASIQKLRALCRMRTATLCETLNGLCESRLVSHGPGGYRFVASPDPLPVSVSLSPIETPGNGNGKPPTSQPPLSQQNTLFGETDAGTAGTQPAEG